MIDFDFYDSLYDDKFVTFETFLIEHFDKNSYFRDVHIFIDKIIELIVIKKICQNVTNIISSLLLDVNHLTSRDLLDVKRLITVYRFQFLLTQQLMRFTI